MGDQRICTIQEIKTYYDAHVAGKLRGFVEGNERIERAWLTLEQWAPLNPRRILEIGCGIGDICFRMSRRWPEAEVIGLDISQKSLEIARKLFPSSRLTFYEGPLLKGRVAGKFDLIVLMDVYEHIAVENRPVLHEALGDMQNESSRIFLSFPTPRHLAWLRQYQPDQIQPVDEDVTLHTIIALARDLGSGVQIYQEVGVWHEGDYAHAVLGRRDGWVAVARDRSPDQRIRRRMRKFLFRKTEPLIPSRSQRLVLVQQRLDPGYYPD